jgi:PhnB protein
LTSINAYLTFNGNCEEAFNFYHAIFGGEPLVFSRFKEFQPEDFVGNGEGDKVMHVALPIGPNTVLMGSDTAEVMGTAVFGSNFSLSLQTDSKAAADSFYEQLSAGGQATMPLDNAPWGSYFGMLTDKFDIQWMINYDPR